MEKLLDSAQLGAIIKQRRKESGMTQEVAAAFCGVTKKTLLKVEKGGDVYLSTVLKIINGLGIDLTITTSELASGDGEQSDWF